MFITNNKIDTSNYLYGKEHQFSMSCMYTKMHKYLSKNNLKYEFMVDRSHFETSQTVNLSFLPQLANIIMGKPL